MLFKDPRDFQGTLQTFARIVRFYTLSSKFSFVFFKDNSEYCSESHVEKVDCFKSEGSSEPGEVEFFTLRERNLTGIVAATLQEKEPLYFENVQICEFFNELIDLDTSQNLATIPVIFMNQLPLGVFQVSGNFRVKNGTVEKEMNDCFLYFAELLAFFVS